MSILRGSFSNRSGNVDDASQPGGGSAGAESGQPEVLPGESVTAALARLRKFHKAEGEGIAISQPLHREGGEGAAVSQANSFAELPAASMWDMDDDFEGEDLDEAPPVPSREGDAPVAPVTPRRAGRVRTRLMGIEHSNGSIEELSVPMAPPGRAPEMFAVGWLAVVNGPGRGHSFVLSAGVSQIGRGEDQAISLDFGDMAISREGHASIAYDEETRSFYLGHGGKQNIVRLNNRPVLGTETLKHGDLVRIGETTLMLAALCGDDFSWSEEQKPKAPAASPE